MSPIRSQQPQDAPEHKKRKPNAPVSSGTSKVAGGSRPQVARIPAPPVSDSSITLDGDSPPSKDKGKAVEKDPLILELERLRKEVLHKNEVCVAHHLPSFYINIQSAFTAPREERKNNLCHHPDPYLSDLHGSHEFALRVRATMVVCLFPLTLLQSGALWPRVVSQVSRRMVHVVPQ